MKHVMPITLTLGALIFMTPAFANDLEAPAGERMYDTDTKTLLVDSDADSYPDLTEKNVGTDPMDASSFPFSELLEKASDDNADTRSAGFPRAVCRPGFRTVARLCIDFIVQGATRHDFASFYCRNRFARVATYEDLSYLYYISGLDSIYNPNGRWIGNIVADDNALRGNRSITFNNDPDINNFEGTANKGNNRQYWCAHDRE